MTWCVGWWPGGSSLIVLSEIWAGHQRRDVRRPWAAERLAGPGRHRGQSSGPWMAPRSTITPFAALSAWELDCHASVTGTFQVNRHHWLSVSAREVPVLTPRSGTRRLAHVGDDHRSVDLLLTMSIPGRCSTAAMLVRASFVVVVLPVRVSGFRSVLARGWHGATS